jgi:hypothetical protein
MSISKILVIVGAVLLVLGLFLPFISAFGVGASVFSLLSVLFQSALLNTLLLLAAVVLAVVAAVFALINRPSKQLAILAGVLGIVAIVWNILAAGDIGAMLPYLGIGFWLYAVGSVVELVGGVLKS